jgi:hypothetical protein
VAHFGRPLATRSGRPGAGERALLIVLERSWTRSIVSERTRAIAYSKVRRRWWTATEKVSIDVE